MDTIQIDSGEITLSINGSPDRVISFTPTDALFAERFYAVYGEIREKMAEYQRRAAAEDDKSERDDAGVPKNSFQKVAIVKETCMYVREKIDYLFGAGTADKVYGQGTLDVLMFYQTEQFFKGLMPHFESGREKVVAQYTANANRATKRAYKKRSKK